MSALTAKNAVLSGGDITQPLRIHQSWIAIPLFFVNFFMWCVIVFFAF